MATQILAVGNTAAFSSNIVVANGASVTVCLKDVASPNLKVGIHLLDDEGRWNPMSFWFWAHVNVLQFSGPGTYRLVRRAGDTCGAFIA